MEVSLLSQRSDVATPIRSITERHSLFPASFTRCPNSVPCGNACPEGRGIGLTLFRLNDTPAAFVSVCSILPVEHPAACLLARACQRLWLFGGYGACGGSPLLDISFSLTLPPPWRWQWQRTPHGVLLVEKDRGLLSRRLSTQPLPATPTSIGYCGRNRRFCLRSFRIEQSFKQLQVARKSPPVSRARRQKPRPTLPPPPLRDTPQRPGHGKLRQGRLTFPQQEQQRPEPRRE